MYVNNAESAPPQPCTVNKAQKFVATHYRGAMQCCERLQYDVPLPQ